MSFVEAVTTCISKYCDFKGRARRSEYWFFYLAVLAANIVVLGLASVLFGADSPLYTLISAVLSLAVFLPNLGVSVRRMHDIGKSGWALLIFLIPLVGPILLFIWILRDSMPGDNRYGPNPKGNYGYQQPGYSYSTAQPNRGFDPNNGYGYNPNNGYAPNGSYNPNNYNPSGSYNPKQNSGDPWDR